MTKIRLRFVQAFVAHGKPYYYFRKPGCARVKLPGLPGSVEFMDAYQAALAASAPSSDIGAKRSSPGTAAALVAVYANSSQFKHEIAAETRRTTWSILQRFRNEHGSKRVALLRPQHVLAMLEGRRPFARRNWLRALRALMQFAVSINWIAHDPTEGMKVKLPRAGEGLRAWGEEQIAAFRNRHGLGTRQRLALELLLNTAQRRGDAIRMGPQHIRNGKLHVRQQKTGVPLVLGILPELREAIDAMPSAERHLTFVVTPAGKPYTPGAFSRWFREACEAAGLHGFTAHGLRKAAMRRMAEAGCTVHEIVACSGHKTLAQVAHYTRSVEQERLATEAMAKTRTKVSKFGGQTVKIAKKVKEIKG
jgi:integrase